MTHTDKQITDLISEAEICADAERDVLGEEAYVAGLLDSLVAVVKAEHQRAREWDKIERLAHQRLLAERDALRAQILLARGLLITVHCGQEDHDDALEVLSRAIDTKEKP